MPELTKVQTGFLEPQGPFKLDPGTESAPGIYFEGDENTGLYRSAENEIAVTVDGTQKAKFNSDGLVGNVTGNLTGNLTGESTIQSISSEIADTAVDIFIYDTSKDSDGGAWRKRTQHTSWYNETLNTATRGSRREFPAVAVIVMQEGTLTIYDGDDPDLPMWMVFTDNNDTGSLFASAKMLSCRTATSIFMLNGIFVCGGKGPYHDGVTEINFLTDSAKKYMNNGYYYNTLNISQRESTGGYYTVTSGTPSIVSNLINDVAMTVLPNAPIDPSTGLPIPTIAVATDGGVSVIKDDGSVYDGFTSITSIVGIIQFSGNKVIYAADNDSEYKWIYQFDIPSSDNTGNSYLIDPNSIITNYNHNADFSSYSAIPLDSTGSGDQLNYTNDFKVSPDNNIFVGAGRKLAIVDFEDGTYNSRTALTSLITSTYNTGYLPWNIKGAFLSDTDDTDVTGTELHPNGNSDFSSTDVSYISNTASGTATVSSGQLVLSGGTANYSDHILTVSNLEVGAQYIITIDYVSKSAGASNIGFYVNGSYLPEVNDGSGYISRSTGNSYSFYFTTEFSSRTIDLVTGGSTSETHTFDNWSIKKVEEDRSVNNNGLQVFGTITKTPVATGADLVAYSGFSANNYLIQPYNSDLDFGTGDFCYMCWVKDTNVGSGAAIFQRGSTVNSNETVFYIDGSNRLIGRIQTTSNAPTTATNTFIEDEWNHCVFLRSGGISKIYHNGREVASTSNTQTTDQSGQGLSIGAWLTNNYYFVTSISLFKVSVSAPSPEQIKKIYEDEKVLFQENAACTLYGSSDAVTALAYDEVTERLHVGTSSGRSEFQGLRRINNTTTAVTTAISAYDSFVVEQ